MFASDLSSLLSWAAAASSHCEAMLQESEPESRPPPVLAGLRSAGADGLKILDVRRLRSRQVSKISVCPEHRKVSYWGQTPISLRCIRTAPAGRAIGSANSGSDPKNSPDCGSPFFGLPYFGEAKKGESPAAAAERHRNLSKDTMHDAKQGFDTSARSFDTSGRTESGLRQA